MKLTKIIQTLLVAVLVFSFSANLGFAVTTQNRAQEREKNETTEKANFCTRFDSLRTDALNKMADLESKRQERKTELQNRLEQSRTERSTRMEEARNKAQEKLEEANEKIDDLTKTESQKQALIAFKQTVKKLQTDRKTAIDSAQKAFKTKVDEYVASRNNLVKSAMDAYKSTVQTAINSAKTACSASNVDPNAIRDTLQTAMKTAREKLQADLKGIEKIGTTLSVETKKRNDAIRSAHETFKSEFEQAKTELKTALENETSSETEE